MSEHNSIAAYGLHLQVRKGGLRYLAVGEGLEEVSMGVYFLKMTSDLNPNGSILDGFSLSRNTYVQNSVCGAEHWHIVWGELRFKGTNFESLVKALVTIHKAYHYVPWWEEARMWWETKKLHKGFASPSDPKPQASSSFKLAMQGFGGEFHIPVVPLGMSPQDVEHMTQMQRARLELMVFCPVGKHGLIDAEIDLRMHLVPNLLAIESISHDLACGWDPFSNGAVNSRTMRERRWLYLGEDYYTYRRGPVIVYLQVPCLLLDAGPAGGHKYIPYPKTIGDLERAVEDFERLQRSLYMTNVHTQVLREKHWKREGTYELFWKHRDHAFQVRQVEDRWEAVTDAGVKIGSVNAIALHTFGQWLDGMCLAAPKKQS